MSGFCRGTETVTVTNSTDTPIVVETIGSLFDPFSDEPYRVDAHLPSGATQQYGVGDDSPGIRLGNRPSIFNDPVSGEGVEVVTSVGTLRVFCAQGSASLPLTRAAPTQPEVTSTRSAVTPAPAGRAVTDRKGTAAPAQTPGKAGAAPAQVPGTAGSLVPTDWILHVHAEAGSAIHLPPHGRQEDIRAEILLEDLPDDVLAEILEDTQDEQDDLLARRFDAVDSESGAWMFIVTFRAPDEGFLIPADEYVFESEDGSIHAGKVTLPAGEAWQLRLMAGPLSVNPGSPEQGYLVSLSYFLPVGDAVYFLGLGVETAQPERSIEVFERITRTFQVISRWAT